MKYNIALVPGDGIGPEIVGAAVEVLKTVADKFGHEFVFNTYLAGGSALDEFGIPLPQETIDGCLASDSVLLGAVGGPKWDEVPNHMRPEKALLGLRKALGPAQGSRTIYEPETGCDPAGTRRGLCAQAGHR